MSPGWWERVLAAWNRGEHSASLRGLGTIGFETTDGDRGTTWVEWDARGEGRVAPPTADAPLLRATAENWRSFVDGRFGAVTAVFSRRLEYRGDMTRILPFARSFDRLAEVARDVEACAFVATKTAADGPDRFHPDPEPMP